MEPATGADAFALTPTEPAESLVEELTRHLPRVGLEGVLGDLDRTAQPAQPPGSAVAGGFTWDEHDRTDQDWFPQGITTSEDAGGPAPGGRRVLLAGWYAVAKRRNLRGSRITVVDITDLDRPTYRHVLLVEPVRRFGRLTLRPVQVHAGGIAWYEGLLYVTGTKAGMRAFRLDDLLAVPAMRAGPLGLGHRWERLRLGRTLTGGFSAFGYSYLLPQLMAYEAAAGPRTAGLRFSFVSVDRTSTEHQLVTGEYARAGKLARLARWALDPGSGRLRNTDGARAVPLEVVEGQARMQGATVVDGTWYLTASAGEGNPGDVWVGTPGAMRRHHQVLPTGPEDLTYSAAEHRLWTLTEWPGHRYVLAIDPDCLDS